MGMPGFCASVFAWDRPSLRISSQMTAATVINHIVLRDNSNPMRTGLLLQPYMIGYLFWSRLCAQLPKDLQRGTKTVLTGEEQDGNLPP